MGEEFWEAYKDQRWIEKRREILKRDNNECQYNNCEGRSSELHVHHNFYLSKRKPWEYPNAALTTLCKNCHDHVTRLHERLRRILCLAEMHTLERILGFSEMQTIIDLSASDEKRGSKITEMIDGKQTSNYVIGLCQSLEKYCVPDSPIEVEPGYMYNLFHEHSHIDLRRVYRRVSGKPPEPWGDET